MERTCEAQPWAIDARQVDAQFIDDAPVRDITEKDAIFDIQELANHDI